MYVTYTTSTYDTYVCSVLLRVCVRDTCSLACGVCLILERKKAIACGVPLSVVVCSSKHKAYDAKSLNVCL